MYLQNWLQSRGAGGEEGAERAGSGMDLGNREDKKK